MERLNLTNRTVLDPARYRVARLRSNTSARQLRSRGLRMTGSLALALVIGACDTSSGPRDIARDSSGVAIVENVEPAWTADGWRFADEPTITIGVLEGDAGQELHEPRSAVRLTDGRIVVGDQGRYQLRFYDPQGTHLFDVGGRGGGPGEFQRLSHAFRLSGDSLAVYDQTQLRITVFAPDGAYVRAFTLDRTDRTFGPTVTGRLPDGSYLGLRLLRLVADDLPDGLSVDSVMLLRFGTNGGVVDTVGTFPNQVRNVEMRSIANRRFRGTAPIPFSPRTTWTVDEDRVYVGHAQSYEILVYDLQGRLTRIIRRRHEPFEVTETDRANVIARWMEIFGVSPSNPRQGIEVQVFLENLETAPLPDHFPAYDPEVLDGRGRRIGNPLIVDAMHNLWVWDYQRPGEHTPSWSVFDPGGRYLGRVTAPDRFYITEIGSDYVLGWSSDEWDVARVQLYPLIR